MNRTTAHNPYRAPRASHLSSVAERTAIYTPTQVALGTLLGGIVGFVFFLRANFVALGNADAARNTVLGGVVLFVALLGLSYALPQGGYSLGPTLVLVVLARWIAERHQLSKDSIAASSDHDFHSNWRVFAFGLACLVASAAIGVGMIMVITALASG